MKKLTISIAMLMITTISYSQTQCKSKTKDYVQCKNITKKANGLCHNHDPNHVSKSKNQGETVICIGTTKKNTKCKSRTKNKSRLCHHHRKNK